MIDINFQTDTWTQIVKYAKLEIRRLHDENEDTALTEAETNALRGEIRALKNIINLPADGELPVATKTDEYIV